METLKSCRENDVHPNPYPIHVIRRNIPNNYLPIFIRKAKVRESCSISCTFCGKSHQSTVGRTISSVNERKSILRRKNRCDVCLNVNHIAQKCFLKRICQSCGGVTTTHMTEGNKRSTMTERDHII